MSDKHTFTGNLLYGLMHLIGLLPAWWHYLWADVAAFLLRKVFRYRLGTVRGQLTRVFGKEGKKYIKPFYRHLADLAVEYFMLAGFDEKRFAGHAAVTNPEIFGELHREGHRNLFLLIGHLGNWEYYTGFNLFCDTEFNVLYKRQHGVSNEVFGRLRSKFGSRLLDKNEAGSYIVSHRRDLINRTYIFAADQEPPYGSINLYTRFLGQPTATFTGAERLASALSAPVIYTHSRQTKRGHYEVTLELITKDASSLAKGDLSIKYMELLEKDILMAPEQWLWSHKRWKHTLEWRKANDPNFDRQNIRINL